MMKRKDVSNIIIVVLIICGLLFCYWISGLYMIIWSVLTSSAILLTDSFAIPSRFVFKYRFRFIGLVLFSSLNIIRMIKDWVELGKFSQHDFIGIIVVSFMGFFVFGFLNELSFKKKFEKKDLKYLKECSALFDQISYKINDETFSGKLVLAEQRLLLYVDNIEDPLFDYSLRDRIPEIKIYKKWGMPSGFWIDGQIQVLINFPKLWVREIAN